MTSPATAALIIIPSYNAASTLPELLCRIKAAAPETSILVVDDGSTDSTSDILSAAAVSYIRLPKNQGKGMALRVGFQFAIDHGHRSVVTLDADLQHLPEEIPLFLARDDGRTILIGTRQINLRVMPAGRWLSNNWTSMIISVFSARRVRDSQSGFRLIPTDLLQRLPLSSSRYDLESELLFKAGALGYEVAEVPVTTVYQGSKSHIAPLQDTLRFIRQTWYRIWM